MRKKPVKHPFAGHREDIRTIVSLLVLTVQVVMLLKLFGVI